MFFSLPRESKYVNRWNVWESMWKQESMTVRLDKNIHHKNSHLSGLSHFLLKRLHLIFEPFNCQNYSSYNGSYLFIFEFNGTLTQFIEFRYAKLDQNMLTEAWKETCPSQPPSYRPFHSIDLDLFTQHSNYWCLF